MVKCEFCGRDENGLIFTCRYCGQRLCVDHKIPENHQCMYIDIARGESEIFVIKEKNIFKGTRIEKK
jgi:predicted nucleic acid binding AN1-type Zn finger protein